MKVDHFVIHYIRKDKHQNPTILKKDSETRLRGEDGNLSKQGELIEEFVKSASDMFDRQRSGKVYANIKKQENTFAEVLDKYLKGETDFLTFSNRIAEELMKAMKGAVLSTGGFMAIADYKSSPRKLVILMIKQEEGYAVDPDTLELRQSIHLDLNTINVGARIDLEDYQKGENQHLSMVKGLKEIAKYFRDFLGVENFKDAKTETEELKTIVDTYLKQNPSICDPDKIPEVKRTFANLIVDSKGSEISLMAIAGIINPANPQDFHDFANNKGVSALIHGDLGAVKGWLRVHYKDKRLTLDFEKGLLNEVINYYRDKDELVLKVSAFPDLGEKLEQADQ